MVAILLGTGFEEIEALSPCDILRRGGVEVKLAGVGAKTVTGAHGISVQADCTVEELCAGKLEMLVLPGGMGGVASIRGSAPAMDLIRQVREKEIPLAAICAAPTIPGAMGLLQGKKAVCYPGMEGECIGADMTQEAPVQQDGNVITGRGPGASLLFGLRLLTFLKGQEAADRVAAGMHDLS